MKTEDILVNSLSGKELLLFKEKFFKVSPRRWITSLKNYDDVYSIREVIAIISITF